MKKNKKKKPIFEKVGLVFRSPIRADIMKEISTEPKRPIDIAENIGIQKQNLNYHLNELKKGGLVETNKEVRNEDEIPSDRGIRINGATENGQIKYSHGVKLTKNGKDIVDNFLNQLYEEGHTIKLFTARGAQTGIDWREITEEKLAEWGVKYHELLMTKPHADIFIDDKAINADDWMKSNTLRTLDS